MKQTKANVAAYRTALKGHIDTVNISPTHMRYLLNDATRAYLMAVSIFLSPEGRRMLKSLVDNLFTTPNRYDTTTTILELSRAILKLMYEHPASGWMKIINLEAQMEQL